VPISFIIEGRSYRDGVDITPKEVYEFVASSKRLPTTTSPSPGEFLQAYHELSEWARGIICVTICSDISMMYDSAIQAKQMAARELPGLAIDVLDSRTAGGAQGFVAMAAARAAAAGRSLEEVTEVAAGMVPRVNMIAALETLQYLAKAGRIPRVAAWGSSILKINPILTFSRDGIGLLEKARTKGKAVQRLVEIMEERTGDRPVHVNVMHANTIAEAEALRERVESRFNCVELYVTDFAPTMGVQAGPGVVALAFYREEDSDVE
jgi:DegV family protein with EDD domain